MEHTAAHNNSMQQTALMLGVMHMAAIVYILVLPTTLFAWCPEYNIPIEREYQSSNSVFIAKVEDEIPVIDKENDFIEGHVYILKSLKWYKGSELPMVVTYSGNSSGRFNMQIGESYLLFSEVYENPMVISNCGNLTVA